MILFGYWPLLNVGSKRFFIFLFGYIDQKVLINYCKAIFKICETFEYIKTCKKTQKMHD